MWRRVVRPLPAAFLPASTSATKRRRQRHITGADFRSVGAAAPPARAVWARDRPKATKTTTGDPEEPGEPVQEEEEPEEEEEEEEERWEEPEEANGVIKKSASSLEMEKERESERGC